MPICAQGHESADDEFCDVCGLAFERAAPVAVAEAEPAPPAAPRPCPSCGAQLDGRFCENCGADSLAEPVPAPVSAPVPVPAAPVAAALTWSVVVSADERYFRAVKADGGPDADPIEFPPFCPERSFPLVGEQITIGRHSHTRGISPDIDLTGPPEDIGVSRLHALLVPAGEGWSVVDMNSANGTTVNYGRTPLKPNTPHPLTEGDRIHVGAWTTLTLHRT
ncbi:FHA domain-containing protein [Amycolatopsis sp. GM8]|uniref:FHA domain-containing protein n=1 Tax=Amycolatopsis sp. GM8 TaxID=2896530 RepID=UPI001F375BB8|nr:FHA domain-containing protein [Amycolatopsis sp. GM8]